MILRKISTSFTGKRYILSLLQYRYNIWNNVGIFDVHFGSILTYRKETLGYHYFCTKLNQTKEGFDMNDFSKPYRRTLYNTENSKLSTYEFNRLIESYINNGEMDKVEECLQGEEIRSLKGGLLTYLINTYLDYGEIDKAVVIFEQTKEQKKIKHLRLYTRIISSYCSKRNLKMASKYFQEFDKLELSNQTSRLKQPNNELLHDLVKTAVLIKKEKPKKELKSLEWLISHVLGYIMKWNQPVHPNVMLALLEWFNLQRFYIQETFIKKSGKCGHCQSDLNVVMNKYFLNQYIIELDKLISESGARKTLEAINKLFVNNTYYDIVIDGGNILYQGSKNEKIFTPERLENLLKRITLKEKGYKRIALVLPQSFHKASKMETISFMKDILRERIFDMDIQMVVFKNLHDDITFLYLSAISEQNGEKNMMMISNDNFLEHRFELDEKLQSDWLKWINGRCHKIDDKGNILSPQAFAPVTRNCKNNMHLVLNTDLCYCISKNKTF